MKRILSRKAVMTVAKRLICMFLCLSMVCCWPLQALAQEEDVLHIRSVEDFLSFAENCVLDRYSRGMTVYLHCDLDLTDTDFRSIPTFGGTFEGQGHRITGLNLTAKGSAVGLFRYLQVTAVVKDLHVSALVGPGGTAAVVGGIAGSNRGVIQNCSFEGSAAGTSQVGGIVGVNELEGYIRNCKSYGVVVGENMTGGVAGYNMGLIENCENHACVNIYTPDASVDITSIDVSVLMDPTSLSAGITVMDTGGVAGYSTGAIYDSVNLASIGYPHIGYNVGGIAGRSCGTISGCTNQAEIQGRKDVGGIVGQMEPNISLNVSEDYLRQLEQQLVELKDLGWQLRESFNQLDVVYDHLDNTLTYVDGASAALEDLTDYIGTYGDAVTEEFNRASLILDEIMDAMVPILEQTADLSEKLSSAMGTFAEAVDMFAVAANYLEASVALMNRATSNLQKAGASATLAMEQIREGVELLAAAVQVDDPQQLEQAVAQLTDGLSQLAQAMAQSGEAMRTILDVMQQEGTWNEEMAEAAQQLLQAMDTMSLALQNISDGIDQMGQSMHFEEENFWAGVDSLTQGMESLEAASKCLTSAMEDLSYAMIAMEYALEAGAGAMGILADALETVEESFLMFSQIVEDVETLVDRISRYEPIQLPVLDEGATEAVDQLFLNVNSISDELGSIVRVSDDFSAEAAERFDALAEKFSEMLDTTLKLVNQVQDEAANGLISDTSDVDIDGVKAGKVSLCANSGRICGDINVGGIAGAMAIEYQLDPEDDISAELSTWQTRTYQARAIVQDSTNMGQIAGKRNYAGGICGKMDMGIILLSYNFGDVSSSEGGYVGGIAGESASVIRQCGVKATISGGNYVGGIAGTGVQVRDCYAMVFLSGTEKTGSILGYALQEDLQNILRNYYFCVPGMVGAIDGISYDGSAQGAAEEEFFDMEHLDARFPEAVITFRYDDGTQEQLRLKVGSVLVQDMIPQLQNTADEILAWMDLEEYLDQAVYFDRVFTVERKAMTTVVESVQKRENGKSILLLQGLFERSDAVLLEPVTALEGALEGWRFQVAARTLSKIRYAIPAGYQAEDLKIWLQDGSGNFYQVQTQRSGSYLVFAVSEDTTCFYVTHSQQEGASLVWIVVACGVLALGAAAAVLIIRKKKKPVTTRRQKA